MQNSTRFWDKVAPRSGSKPDRSAQKVIQAIQPYLDPDQNILDFGCGSGVIANRLAPYVKSIDGVDTSSGMLQAAKKQALTNSLDNVKYWHSDLFNPDFEDNSYHIILAFNVLHYIEDAKPLMFRVYELLKPEGLFIASTACLKEKRSLLTMLVWLLAKFRLIPTTVFYTHSELEDMVTAGGFQLVESRAIAPLPEYFMVARKG